MNNKTMNSEYLLICQPFPSSIGITDEIRAVLSCFDKHYEEIKSPYNIQSSNGVLRVISDYLNLLNFRVEKSKSIIDKIKVLVLISRNNKIDNFLKILNVIGILQLHLKGIVLLG
jgi:hypothetical protein